MSKPPFDCRIKNYFYSLRLYDDRGREVYDLDTAIEVAWAVYGDSWVEVYNGHEAASNDAGNDMDTDLFNAHRPEVVDQGGEWHPDGHYAAGYAYASGYHD